MKKLNIQNITLNDIHNYCQIGYQFLVELTEDYDYLAKTTKFYITQSEIDDYDSNVRSFYIEEREFAEHNNSLKNDLDYNKPLYISVGLYDGEIPYNLKVLKIYK